MINYYLEIPYLFSWVRSTSMRPDPRLKSSLSWSAIEKSLGNNNIYPASWHCHGCCMDQIIKFLKLKFCIVRSEFGWVVFGNVFHACYGQPWAAWNHQLPESGLLEIGTVSQDLLICRADVIPCYTQAFRQAIFAHILTSWSLTLAFKRRVNWRKELIVSKHFTKLSIAHTPKSQ